MSRRPYRHLVPCMGMFLVVASSGVAGANGETQPTPVSPLYFADFGTLADRLEAAAATEVGLAGRALTDEVVDRLRRISVQPAKPLYGAVGAYRSGEQLDQFFYRTQYDHENDKGLLARLGALPRHITFRKLPVLLVNSGGFFIAEWGHVDWWSVHVILHGARARFPMYPDALDSLHFGRLAWNSFEGTTDARERTGEVPRHSTGAHRTGPESGSWNRLVQKPTVWDKQETILTRDDGEALDGSPIFSLLKRRVPAEAQFPPMRVYRVLWVGTKALCEGTEASDPHGRHTSAKVMSANVMRLPSLMRSRKPMADEVTGKRAQVIQFGRRRSFLPK